MPARCGIGDDVSLHGTVKLVDAAGDGTVTIEIKGTGQRVTMMAQSTYIDLVEKAKGGKGFTRAPKGLK
jgi:hypothetical protein